MLHDTNQKRLKVLVDELLALPADKCSGVEKQVADFYASAMDEEAIEAAGIEPLLPVLAACDASSIEKDVTQVIAMLKAKFGVKVPISFGESPDKKQSEWSIGQIGQSGLGLPDRDYYTGTCIALSDTNHRRIRSLTPLAGCCCRRRQGRQEEGISCSHGDLV